MVWTFLADRGDLAINRIDEGGVGGARVLQFALTANVVTYAITGGRFGYWRLFPASPPWIVPPAWGEVECGGEPLYGLVPIASHAALILEPRGDEFHEASPHRATLDRGYNRYLPANGSLRDREDWMLFRPLVTLGWALVRWLREQDWLGARRLVVTSASSKTALAFAVQAADGPPLLGLSGDIGFVERTGLYAAVTGYDAPPPLSHDDVVLDFAGNAGLLDRLRRHGAPRIVPIGATHAEHESLAAADVFFAPHHVGAAILANGAMAVERARNDAVAAFADRSRPWFTRTYLDGADAIADGFRAMLGNRVPADRLVIARPG